MMLSYYTLAYELKAPPCCQSNQTKPPATLLGHLSPAPAPPHLGFPPRPFSKGPSSSYWLSPSFPPQHSLFILVSHLPCCAFPLPARLLSLLPVQFLSILPGLGQPGTSSTQVIFNSSSSWEFLLALNFHSPAPALQLSMCGRVLLKEGTRSNDNKD